jgi:ketosteroid isomerase-like protein
MRLNLTTFKSAARRCENGNQPEAKSDSVMATNTPAIRTRFLRWARTSVALLAITLLLMPAVASSSAAEAVMAITQAACDAFRRGDVAALERLLTPDFTLVDTAANVQTREQALAEVRAGKPQYEVFRNHHMTARLYGNAAVVQGITTLTGRSNGKPFAVDVRFTDTLVRLDGQWRIAASHVTRMPGP